ncbi:MAG: hypothetical protein AB7S36_19405, partial [Planctomycetota bacterium]
QDADTQAEALHTQAIGEWEIDIDAFRKYVLPGMPEEQRGMVEQQLQMLKGVLQLSVTSDKLKIAFNGQGQEASYKVLGVTDGVLDIETTDANGTVENAHIEFVGASMKLTQDSRPDQQMYFCKKGAAAPELTQPAPHDPGAQPANPGPGVDGGELAKAIVGEWTINIERSVRENPANKGLAEAELKAQIEQGKLMAGAVTIEITDKEMVIEMGQMRIESPYKVLAVENDSLTLEVDAQGQVRQQKVRIVDKHTLQMEFQGQLLMVERKGAPRGDVAPEVTGPYTGPRPEGLHGLMCGEWKVDLEKTLRADPNYKDMSDADLKSAMEFVEMTGEMKLNVSPDKFELVVSGAPSSYGYKLLSADPASSSVKLSITGASGTSSEAIWKVTGTEMSGALDSKPFFFKRDKAPAVAPAGSADGSVLVGTWIVDIDATLARDERFKDKTREEKDRVRKMLQGMTSLLTWTFTADRLIEVAPTGKREYSWKAIGRRGTTLEIEISDDKGNTARSKLTIDAGDQTINGDVNGSMRYLRRQ